MIDASNIKESLLESLVFSFALIGAATKLLDDDPDVDDVKSPPTVLTSSPIAT